MLKLGVEPSRIVYANPCKQNGYIRYAAKQNVDLMTFDNEAELYKVKAAFPNARSVLIYKGIDIFRYTFGGNAVMGQLRT